MKVTPNHIHKAGNVSPGRALGPWFYPSALETPSSHLMCPLSYVHQGTLSRQVKACVTKPGDLSWILRVHMVERKDQLIQVVL